MSFGHAFRGLSWVSRESNARIHAAATAGVIGAGILLRITTNEWALIVFAIAGVWVAEALNTAIEQLADAVVPERHPLIGAAKDIAASAVLIAAVAAIVVGFLVFVPRAFCP